MEQLELNLWKKLETASQFPELVDLVDICHALEQAIAERDTAQQLVLAGNVLVQLAELIANRAERMIGSWEQEHDPTDPVIDLDVFSEFVVQSMRLDVDELIEERQPTPYPQQRRSPTKLSPHDSLAGEVDKDILLDVVEQFPKSFSFFTEEDIQQQVAALAHDEKVSEWAAKVYGYLRCRLAVALQDSAVNSPFWAVPLTELPSSLEMSLIEVWLSLLLNGADEGYALIQTGEDFYDTKGIRVVSMK